jgi:hypothetical protein
MTMASLYRKRGGVVVAAGNNDLDRHFTGIVKERGLIEFLPGTFVLSYRLSMYYSIAAAAPLSISLCSHYRLIYYLIQLFDKLIAQVYPVSPRGSE